MALWTNTWDIGVNKLGGHTALQNPWDKLQSQACWCWGRLWQGWLWWAPMCNILQDSWISSDNYTFFMLFRLVYYALRLLKVARNWLKITRAPCWSRVIQGWARRKVYPMRSSGACTIHGWQTRWTNSYLGWNLLRTLCFWWVPPSLDLNVYFPLVELSIHQVRLVRARKRPGLSRELCGGANGEAGVFIPAMPPEPAKVWKTNEQAENYVLKKTKVWDTNEQAEIHLTMLHGRQCWINRYVDIFFEAVHHSAHACLKVARLSALLQGHQVPVERASHAATPEVAMSFAAAQHVRQWYVFHFARERDLTTAGWFKDWFLGDVFGPF